MLKQATIVFFPRTDQKLKNGKYPIYARVVLDKVAKIGDKVMGWLGFKKQFKADDGHAHTLYFEGDGEEPELMVASTPKTYQKFLVEYEKAYGRDIGKKKNVEKARDIISELNKNIRKKAGDDAVLQKQISDERESILARLAEVTAHLFGAIPERSMIQYGPVNPFGTSMLIEVLTNRPDVRGSKPSVDNSLYYILNRRRNATGSAYYIKGHLLNQKLGGPGDTWQNLAPLTQKANGMHEQHVESVIKGGVGLGAILKYEIVADYDRPHRTSDNPDFKDIIEAESFVPTHLIATAWVLEQNDNGIFVETKIFDKFPINNQIETDERAYHTEETLNRDTVFLYDTDISELVSIEVPFNGKLTPLIDDSLAYKIIKTYNDNNKDTISSDSHLINLIGGLSGDEKTAIRKLCKIKYVKIN